MQLVSLNVKNFRNIASAELDFGDVNAFIGNNAQGKTNLMEALSVAIGKSFRKAKANEIVPIGKKDEHISIELVFSADSSPERLNKLVYEQSGAKTKHTYNGIDIKEACKLYTEMKYVIFIPDDLYLIKGNPDLRRSYVDGIADQMNRIHHERLSEYRRALFQKNNFLASIRSERLSQSEQLMYGIWNENIARLGVNVMSGRIKYFNMLCRYANKYYNELNNNNEILTVKYESSIMGDEEFDISDTELILNRYLQKLQETQARELQTRFTQTGVHRDDISFFINGMNAKSFASQGQIRSIALALRLAEAEMLSKKWLERPLIILDDVLSELDAFRRSYVLHQIVNYQIFITGCNCADFCDISGNKCWNVDNGAFSPQ